MLSALVNRQTHTPTTGWLQLQKTTYQRKLQLERHADQTQSVWLLRPGRDLRAADTLSCLGQNKTRAPQQEQQRLRRSDWCQAREHEANKQKTAGSSKHTPDRTLQSCCHRPALWSSVTGRCVCPTTQEVSAEQLWLFQAPAENGASLQEGGHCPWRRHLRWPGKP